MDLFIIAIVWRFLFSLHEKCQYHYETFWLCKLIPWMRPNWRNRYVKNQMGELVVDKGKYRVKWWAWVFPFDGVHLLKQLMVFAVLNLAYFGIDATVDYLNFMIGMAIIFAAVHIGVMQRERYVK